MTLRVLTLYHVSNPCYRPHIEPAIDYKSSVWQTVVSIRGSAEQKCPVLLLSLILKNDGFWYLSLRWCAPIAYSNIVLSDFC